MSHQRITCMLWAGAIAVGLAAGGAAAQTIWHVDDDACPLPGSGTHLDPFCSIQDAIAASADGDEIAVAPGTYTESLDLLGRAVWLHSTDGPAVTTIDGAGAAHVVVCAAGEGAGTILEGFTITGGSAVATGIDGLGGGLYVEGDPTVINCLFIANDAMSGGGVCVNHGAPAFIDCTFESNTAANGAGMLALASDPLLTRCIFRANGAMEFGGGLLNLPEAEPDPLLSNPILTDCEFIANTATRGGGAANGDWDHPAGGDPAYIRCLFVENDAMHGGGMWSSSSPHGVMEECLFLGNTASEGGGLWTQWSDSRMTITECDFIANVACIGGAVRANDASRDQFTACRFLGNDADINGGALADNGAELLLEDCLLADNHAALDGGAIYNVYRSELTRCTFLRNEAGGDGGAVHLDSAESAVTDCVFADNRAAGRGGAVHKASDWNGALEVSGSAFTHNEAGTDGGAICAWHAQPMIATSTFADNDAGARGGAVLLVSEGPSALADCAFLANRAQSTGGALGVEGRATITRCQFTGNVAEEDGGGAHCSGHGPVLLECTFTDNAAWGDGGGVLDASEVFGQYTCCTFRENFALASGGGLHAAGAQASLMNVLFAANIARLGAGLYSVGDAEVVNATFAMNLAPDGGHAAYNDGGLIIRNSVLWDAGFGSEIAIGMAVPTVEYSTVRGGWSGPGNGDADPRFVDPPSFDFRLSRGSPCIDAGANALVPQDFDDLDGDGDIAEHCPIDLGFGERFIDDPWTVDTGTGATPLVDHGALEYTPPACGADLTGPDGQPDGNVDALDFLVLLAQWGMRCGGNACIADISGPDFGPDGIVDHLDMMWLLFEWGSPGNCPDA